MATIAAGVIGIGFIGEAHIEALRRLGGIHVAAIAGSSEEQAQRQARRLGVDRFYGSWRQLIEDPAIDAVHICTPNHLHFPIAKFALEHGKHVICEKPFVLTEQEGRLLLELANERQLVHAVHFNLRYYPLVQQARVFVGNGEAGRLFHFQGHYLQDWLHQHSDYNWRMEPAAAGEVSSRAVADIGIHLLDMAEYVTGLRIKALCAQTAIVHQQRLKPTHTGVEAVRVQTEDYAAILLEFENGAKGNVTVSQVAAGRKNQLAFELNGSSCSLGWNSENPDALWIGHRSRPNEQLMKDPGLMYEEAAAYAAYPAGHVEGFPDTSKKLFKDVYAHIAKRPSERESQPTFPTFAAGVREVALCEAVMKSAGDKRWVNVY